MNISYDITTDVRFKQGLEKGLEQVEINTISTIRNLLKMQIVSDSKTIALILDISVNFVEKTKEELKKETQLLKVLSVKEVSIDALAKQFKVSKVFIRTMKRISKKKK